MNRHEYDCSDPTLSAVEAEQEREDDALDHPCPVCHAPTQALGALGWIEHRLCPACGAEHHVTIPRPSNTDTCNEGAES